MKQHYARCFLLGLAGIGFLSGCGGLDSPDGWAQAPMPGAEAPQAERKTETKPATKASEEEAAPKADEPGWWSRQKKTKDSRRKTKQESVAPKAPTPTPTPAAKPKPLPEAPAPAAVPVAKSIGGYPVATRAKVWSGNVISPYDGRMINVTGIASGSLVADPRYPLDQKKYFVVP